MKVRALRLVLLGAAAVAVQMAAASTTTCPVYVQSEETSTLTDPITKVVTSTDDDSATDSDASSSSDGSSGLSGSSSSDGFTDAGSTAGSSNADVGGSDSSGTTATAGSTGSSSAATGSTTGSTASGSSSTPSSTTRTPSSTTATPSTTTSAPSTTTSTTGSASTGTTTTTTPTTTTATPSTTTSTSTTTTSSGSTTDSNETGTTSVDVSVRRRMQTVSVGTGSTSATVSTDTTASGATTGVTASASAAGTSASATATASSSSAATSTSVLTSGSGSATVSSSSADSDVLSCDDTFYSQWDTLGLTCGGSSLDVDQAVSAASCVIYSGSVGTVSGSTCVSICAFPACTDGAWDYGADNGIASSVYDGLEIDSFLTDTVIAALEERASSVSTFLANSTMTDSEQCTYTSESSFDDCTCSAWLIDSSSSGSVADAAKKKQRAEDEAEGVITEDDTTSAGSVVAATSKSVASVTVAITGVAAIASTAVGGVSSASASIAAAGSTMAITTVDICQFGVLINQLDLTGKSSALALFGKAMAPATFTFLPFGQLDDDEDSSSSSSGSTSTSSSGSSTRRRLASGSSSSSSSTDEDTLSGIAKYARQVGVQEDMLFIVTLAGVACIMAGVVGLFGLGYVLSGLVMTREEYLSKFFDKMIGLEVLVAILSQYTIGVTGTFQIYYSVHYESFWNAKCLFAVAALLFLAAGILVYGYFIIKKHEAEIADVGTVQHLKKTVNMRYGPLYEEYKYKNRFFFAAKMMVALTTGVITGCASMSSTVQISIILFVQVLFFFYLEIQSPHHSKFVQTTTSFVSIMKIAVLVLTFFLISAAASDGFPSSLQNGISLAIVGLNLFVLGLLMVRSLYMLWKKFKLQRDAQYDEEEQTAQDYFKDETPQQRKEGVRASGQAPAFQSQPSNNPYVEGGNVDYSESDEIRLRSATHIRDERNAAAADDPHQHNYDTSRQSAANHYIANDRNTYGQRRNDVVEL